MLDHIELIAQNAIRIDDGKILYFDPYKLKENHKNDADYIFITHSHYDHFSSEDILKIKKENTKIILTSDIADQAKKLGFNDITIVEPNNIYAVDNYTFSTTPAYNIDKDFHKKEYNWIGYILKVNGKDIYVAGDTDNIPEIRNVKCDIAFVPVGGTYTMDYLEAADLIEKIKPKIAVPTHYTIVGSREDAENFKNELKDNINVEIMM